MTLFDDIESGQHGVLPIPGARLFQGFVSEVEELALIAAIDTMPWSTELQRRVQHYGYRYDYKSRRVDPSMRLGELPDFSMPLQRNLVESGMLETPPDQLIINEYLPGQGISAHTDCIDCFQDRIASLSLGWTCEMDFLHPESRGCHSAMLERRSLLLLSGEARYEWMHRIRARRSDHGAARQRRISMTFRRVIL